MRCTSNTQSQLTLLSRTFGTYRSRHVTTPSGPVDVDVLALLVCLVGVLWLDPEGVRAEVVTLCLQEVGWQVFRAVSVVEAERGAESGCGDAPERTLGDNTGNC